jgi:hypothetical protein
MASLVKRFQDYSAWRAGVTLRVRAYRRWLEENDLLDGQTDVRLEQLIERLADDKLTIAFVAEFSRGKFRKAGRSAQAPAAPRAADARGGSESHRRPRLSGSRLAQAPAPVPALPAAGSPRQYRGPGLAIRQQRASASRDMHVGCP